MNLALGVEGTLAGLTPEERALLLERAPATASDVARAATAVVERVRIGGDSALRQLATEFDGVELGELEVEKANWEAAAHALPEGVGAALERAARNVARFHAALVPGPVQLEPEPGVLLERRVSPVGRAGVYAPGGRASYPSSVLMGAVPARTVGVSEVVVCSPPGPDGHVAEIVQAACWFAGVDRLFAIGGAGAIAAMTFGTETVPRVDVLVGPGNAYVNEAKRQLAGTVRIDSPAGPSELLVLADMTVHPTWVAAEMIAQSEHDADACVGAVCLGDDVARAVKAALAEALTRAPRHEIARAALARQGFILTATDIAEAVAFANAYAPEHLSIMTNDAAMAAAQMRSSGTIFVGAHSSVAFGDYMTGANHVLPTAGAARSYSGLSSEHFLRSYTVQTLSAKGAGSLSEPTAVLAEAEGLPGHATAARLRSTPASGASATEGGAR